MSNKAFVLVEDGKRDLAAYFIELGLGLFWLCSCDIERARKFRTRAEAVKMLHRTGKHREGWRVLMVQP